MAIKIGDRYSNYLTITNEMSAIKVGSGLVDVFATPSLIAFVEKTASDYLSTFLQPNEVSVGIEINTKHVAASKIGAKVMCNIELIEINKNKFTFTFTVFENEKVVGCGQHTRCVVDKQRFMSKLN